MRDFACYVSPPTLRNRMSVETMDRLCFIYMNMRTLRHARGDKDWETEEWEKLKDDILLNIEDEIVDDKSVEM
ncbi:hypothetical protein V8E51_007523 [Hyaloscypha variabilis]